MTAPILRCFLRRADIVAYLYSIMNSIEVDKQDHCTPRDYLLYSRNEFTYQYGYSAILVQFYDIQRIRVNCSTEEYIAVKEARLIDSCAS